MQLQIPINGLPINLVLLSNGTVVFVKVAPVGVLFDQPEVGVGAMFEEEQFYIGGEYFNYNTIYEYKLKPDMLKWLQQQQLQEPVAVFMQGGL